MVANRSTSPSNALVPFLTSAGLQRADQETQVLGFRGEALMESAGFSVAQEIRNLLASWGNSPKIVILSGPGNNGADGLVASRYLLAWGYTVSVILTSDRTKGFNEIQQKLATMYHVPVFGLPELEVAGLMGEADVVVDCIFGTGLKGSLDETLSNFLSTLRPRCQRIPESYPFSGTFRISVDYPTGNMLFHPHVTFMLGAANLELYEPDLRPTVGKLIYLPIPFAPQTLESERLGWLATWNVEVTPSFLSPPALSDLRLDDPFAYKNSRGSFGVLGGSATYPRAPWLTIFGAVKTGIGFGYVQDTVLENEGSLSSFIPIPTQSQSLLESFFSATKLDVLVLGPGWTLETPETILWSVLKVFLDPDFGFRKVLLDAGALKLLSANPQFFEFLRGHPSLAQRVLLTPHLGELRALAPQPTLSATLDRAQDLGVWILLKYSSMMLAGPQRQLFGWDNPNPAMGFGGSGDILAGLLGGLGARWMEESWETVVQSALPYYLSTGEYLFRTEGFIEGQSFINHLGQALLGRLSN